MHGGVCFRGERSLCGCIQVFMAREQGAEDAEGFSRYTLLGRVRNEVQEVIVESALDRDSIKEAVALTLSRVSSLARR